VVYVNYAYSSSDAYSKCSTESGSSLEPAWFRLVLAMPAPVRVRACPRGRARGFNQWAHVIPRFPKTSCASLGGQEDAPGWYMWELGVCRDSARSPECRDQDQRSRGEWIADIGERVTSGQGVEGEGWMLSSWGGRPGAGREVPCKFALNFHPSSWRSLDVCGWYLVTHLSLCVGRC